MSDTTLLGVLRMPFNLAMATPTARIQYHQRGVQAADEIEKRTRERDEARAEVERQERHIKELQGKIDAEKSCCCSYDAPGDVCGVHSPALMDARAEVERLREVIRTIRARCVEMDDSDAVSETLDISSAALGDEP